MIMLSKKRGSIMRIHGKIQFKEAIIVDKKLLTDLEAVILSFFKKVIYKCKLCNDDNIEFESLEELLNYQNNKSRKIVSLEIKFDCNKINFGPTFSMYNGYRCTVSGEYEVYDSDMSILFSEKVKRVLENGRRSKWYTFLTKISMMHFIIFILAISIGTTIHSVIKEGVVGKEVYTINSLNLSMVIVILIIVISVILAKCRNALLPAISFMIGEQIQEIKRNEDRFSKIFWGILVAFIVSFIVAKIA